MAKTQNLKAWRKGAVNSYKKMESLDIFPAVVLESTLGPVHTGPVLCSCYTGIPCPNHFLDPNKAPEVR